MYIWQWLGRIPLKWKVEVFLQLLVETQGTYLDNKTHMNPLLMHLCPCISEIQGFAVGTDGSTQLAILAQTIYVPVFANTRYLKETQSRYM